MEQQMFYLIKDLGFPMFIAIILLYDKIKVRDDLLVVIKSNTEMLAVVKDRIIK